MSDIPGREGGSQGPELSRDLGFPAVFATATGTMIGAGIFVLPGIAAEGAGPAAALSFLIAGLVTCVAALSVSELATAMPRAGGDYFFVSRAGGPLLGSMVGMGAWLALVLKGSFALVGLGQYVLHFSPVPVLLTAAGAGVGLTVVNGVGAKASGTLQNVIVVALLLIMAAFSAVGLFSVERETIEPYFPHGWDGVLATTGVVFISYLGIMKAAAISEEVKDPGRNIPLGILASVVTVTVLYVLTMVVVTGVLPLAEVVEAPAPVADAGAVFLGALGGMVVAVAGILATLSTGNAALLSSSRYPFAMARDGLVPDWVSRIHERFRTPLRSILVTGAIMTGLALVLDVEGLAKLGGAFGLVVFALVNVSVIVLRRADPDWYEPTFKVPFYPVLPALGALAALAPLPGMGLLSHAAVVGVGILATGWYFWRRRAVEADGKVLQPEYSLGDRVQELLQIQSLEEKEVALGAEGEEPPAPEAPEVVGEVPEAEERAEPEEALMPEEVPELEEDLPQVVVEVPENLPNKHILTVAAALARRFGARVEVVAVTEVPYQVPLSQAAPRVEEEWAEKMERRMEEHGVPFRLHQVLARDRARALLAFTGPRTRVLLLDWRKRFTRRTLLGSYVDQVVRRSASRVAVLKFRDLQEYRKILVATAGSPYATAEVELADAVASHTEATLSFLMVLPPDASETREEQARKYLERLDEISNNPAELLLVRSDDVPGAILEAARERDLIVLGSTREVSLGTMFGRHMVGRVADEIAERAEGSVLLTRDPGVGRRTSNRVVDWVTRVTLRALGRLPPEYGAGTAEGEEGKAAPGIQPFPRERRDSLVTRTLRWGGMRKKRGRDGGRTGDPDPEGSRPGRDEE